MRRHVLDAAKPCTSHRFRRLHPHSAVDIWPADFGIVPDIAHGAKFGAPIAAAVLQQYLAATGMGHRREDDAAVAKVYARNAGLTLPEKKD